MKQRGVCTGPRQGALLLLEAVDNDLMKRAVGFHALYPTVYGQWPVCRTAWK